MGNQQMLGGASAVATPGGYGRKDIDDMVRKSYFKTNTYEDEQPHGLMILDGDGLLAQQQRLVPLQVLNQHIAQHANYQPPSHYSSRETGYNSGTESYRFNRNQPDSTVFAR